jgi:hypothetical protein
MDLGRRVVGRRAVAEVGVGDQVELLQELEGAVDGRDVHPAGGLLDAGADLVGRPVAHRGHGLQHELALRGQPVAAGPQRRLESGRLRVLRLVGHQTRRSLAERWG